MKIERTRLRRLYAAVEDAGTPDEAEQALETFRTAIGMT